MDFTYINVRRGFKEIEEIYDIVAKNNGYICGGYVRWMCSDNSDIKATDVDIFCKDEDSYSKIKKIFSRLFEETHENDICICFSSEEFDNETGKMKSGQKIQLIKPRKEGYVCTQGTIEEIINSFDFTIARIGLISPDTAICDVNFRKDDVLKELHIKHIVCPISSVMRIAKYSRKGFFINTKEIIQLFLEWDRRGDEYKKQIYDALEILSEDELSQQQVDMLETLLRID